jgi:hypothetical protein
MMLAASLALPLPAALGLPSLSFAGPPEAVSGRMDVDEVSQALRRYQHEFDEDRRVNWLRKVAPTRDPRVGVAMGEYLSAGNPFPHQISVAWMLTEHFMPSPVLHDDVVEQTKAARLWWRDNEADLRRRAKQLPR